MDHKSNYIFVDTQAKEKESSLKLEAEIEKRLKEIDTK
jgi:hypothetical protein